MLTPSDKYYAQPLSQITPFTFNSEVAEVFDDMVTRSVPMYRENQHLTVEILRRILRPGERVYDLGCSTGTTMVQLATGLRGINPYLVGVDVAVPMTEKARLKLKAFGIVNAEVMTADIAQAPLETCGAVIMNYTLQFLPIAERLPLLRKIHAALRPGGVLIMAEKIQTDALPWQSLLTDVYYDFKRANGYSELEIVQKREALENVLIPLTPAGHNSLLLEAGFTDSEIILRWANFATLLAAKP